MRSANLIVALSLLWLAPTPALGVELLEAESDYCTGEALNPEHCQDDGLCVHFWKRPIYPEDAARDRRAGSVLVEFRAREDGCTVDAAVVESSDPIFEEAALRAVRQWRFSGASERMTRRITFEIEADET